MRRSSYFMNLGMKNEPKISPVTIKRNSIFLSLQKLVDILSLKRNKASSELDINDMTPKKVILESTFFKVHQQFIKYVQ